ncbi:hypothetical protein D1AOALGA4SA_3096 [Olavius algarvensis Delta 1 endosymbiont]|nr:hypothetical protein D1AOALGA4SA_3096 [Olavius algarvensis Delta 1 endosymbiont]
MDIVCDLLFVFWNFVLHYLHLKLLLNRIYFDLNQCVA